MMLKELRSEAEHVHRNEIMFVRYIHAQSEGAEDDAELKARPHRTNEYGLQIIGHECRKDGISEDLIESETRM